MQALGLMTLLCLALFFFRGLLTGRLHFGFIPWNLFLAWLAVVFAWLLTLQLKLQPWSSWQNIILTFIWLLFLPNTWYVLTDFIHIEPTGEVSQLYDVALMSSLMFTGFILGFTSLYLVHKELLQRLSEIASHIIAAFALLLASFAIYLGRDLRWNTWDVLANPGGVVVSVSDRILDPFGHPRALNVTLLFFLLLSTTYFAFWIFTRSLSPAKKGSKR